MKKTRNAQDIFRVDFSLRREVIFVAIGAIIGAITMVVPITFLYTGFPVGNNYFFFSVSLFFLTRTLISFFISMTGSFLSRGKRTVALVVS